MLNKTISIIEKAAILYCVMYTVVNLLVNNMGWFGIATNPDANRYNAYILRSWVILALTAIIFAVEKIAVKGNLPKYIITCTVALALIITFIWALTSGYLWINADEVYLDSFRDLTISVAVPFVIIAAIIRFIRLIQSKKKIIQNK